MNRNEWNGRAVTFGEFNIRQGQAVRVAFKEDGELGSYTCLALSLRYADTDELVFQSVDEVWAQPFRLQQRLFYLAAEAARINGMLAADSDAPAEGDERKANGHAEPPGPSH